MNANQNLRMKAILLTAISATLLSGCGNMFWGVAKPETYVPVKFDAVEYQKYSVAGTGKVSGQVFAKTNGGDIKKGAGEHVLLMPATSYGQQRIDEEFTLGKLATTREDERLIQFNKTGVTDGEGRFTFEKVPEGDYFVVSRVSWNVVMSSSLGPYNSPQGGRVWRKITVKNDETTQAILNFN